MFFRGLFTEIEKWVLGLESFIKIQYFREMDNLYIVGTYLAILIISIYFVFLIGVGILLVAGILIPYFDLK